MDRDVTKAWWAGLVTCMAVAVLGSVALSLLTSIFLMGLPHGWETATSWADIRLRFSWIAGVLVPVTVGTYLVNRLSHRGRTPTHGADRPGPAERGGRHR
ncbi:hypothetical protein EJ357_01530 [Streptomyces cyaneochromogenes]|uniref:Uncharacterized protein n=1 Tax=Streptomyces cyaneochromogenes TaxID=2496836 RepID=A0A3S9LZP7_9ACTN|nr:hypothetical protein [Streptomyces cyaneochromogenes]AZQ32300.1 hypothetical protein EJ357_01530 [Streptomyces cyaneochromogenes]